MVKPSHPKPTSYFFNFMKDSNESLKIPDTLLRPKIGAPSTEEGSPGQGLQAEGVYPGFIGGGHKFFLGLS